MFKVSVDIFGTEGRVYEQKTSPIDGVLVTDLPPDKWRKEMADVNYTNLSAQQASEAEENAKLTPRQQALKAIDGGGSVIINGVQYTKKNVYELPSEAEFAIGNPDYEETARKALEAQMQEVQRQMALLDARRTSANPPSLISGLSDALGTEGDPKKAVSTGDDTAAAQASTAARASGAGLKSVKNNEK